MKIIHKTYNCLDKLAPYGHTILRLALAFVFLYFGYTSITNPGMFERLVPEWTNSFAGAQTLVMIHGWFEMIMGLLLLCAWHTRIIAGLLFLNLLNTVFLLNWGLTSVRDIGILGGLFALATLKKRD